MLSTRLRTGIVGLPNVGKSTLFNALIGNSQAAAANYPFCTIEPNVGIISGMCFHVPFLFQYFCHLFTNVCTSSFTHIFSFTVVPDARLDVLAKINKSVKTLPGMFKKKSLLNFVLLTVITYQHGVLNSSI